MSRLSMTETNLEHLGKLLEVASQEFKAEDQLLMYFQKIRTVYTVIQTLNEQILATVKTGNTEEQTKMTHEGKEATVLMMSCCLRIGEFEKTQQLNAVIVKA